MEKEKQVPSDVKNLLLQEWEPTIKQLKQGLRRSIIKEGRSSFWRSPNSRCIKDSSGARFM